jgi:hypothetical protein
MQDKYYGLVVTLDDPEDATKVQFVITQELLDENGNIFPMKLMRKRTIESSWSSMVLNTPWNTSAAYSRQDNDFVRTTQHLQEELIEIAKNYENNLHLLPLAEQAKSSGYTVSGISFFAFTEAVKNKFLAGEVPQDFRIFPPTTSVDSNLFNRINTHIDINQTRHGKLVRLAEAWGGFVPYFVYLSTLTDRKSVV